MQSSAQNEWLERVLGITRSAVGSETEDEQGEPQEWPEPLPGMPQELIAGAAPDAGLHGMAKWQAAREQAIASLNALLAAVKAMEDPQSDAAIILLSAVRANLTERPETPQQVSELAAYLANDDVVAEAEVPNGFGIVVNLRKPLMEALVSLRAELKANDGAAP